MNVSRWICVLMCVWLVLSVAQGIRLYRHLCVCRAMADVFASDKSVWLRKRRSEDQTAEPHRTGAWEKDLCSLLLKNHRPPVSLLQNTPQACTLHTSTTLKRLCPIYQKTSQRNSSILLTWRCYRTLELLKCTDIMLE